MKLNRSAFAIISLLFISLNIHAQVKEPIIWKNSVSIEKDGTVKLISKALIDKTWHLYGQYSEPAGGIPAEFSFNESSSYKKSGTVTEWPKPHKEYDEIMEANIQFFENEAVFTQRINVLSENDFVVNASFTGQACTSEGMCIPLVSEFEFAVPGLQTIRKQAEKNKTDEVLSEKNETDSIVHKEIDTLKKDTVTVSGDKNLTETNSGNKKTNDNWLIVFLIAFVAGLLTLITPCVFPMIPMTVSFFMKGNKSKSAGLKQAYFFGFSIILIFAVLGLILTLLFGNQAMYIISTHWIPNMIFFVIFMVFALSFFGLFEIIIPNKLIDKSDKQADKGGLSGVFFIALTTVLVSFSCTGPILGGALMELSSGSENSLVFFISMLGFALGFALPFTLLAIFPSVLSKLKSGSWLNSVKIVFGFLEIALGLKFLSMADLGANWRILDRETFLALWIVTFALLGFYLLGKLKFKGDSDVQHISVYRLFMAIITFSFVVYMIPGLWGAPLKTLSGYLPPQTTQDFDIERLIVENKPSVSALETHNEDTGIVKYSDILHLPTGFKGFFDLEQAKAYAEKVNKPIFVDFTGKTCANCREMENNVWNAPEVKKLLNDEFVMLALYADANFIDLDKEDWVTTEDGKVLKKLGQKNLNYQITKFKMNAQPYYVIMDSNEKVLTKENKAYDKDVKNFIAFLNEGIANFKNN